MAMKAIVEIEVDDSKFKAWLAQHPTMSIAPGGSSVPGTPQTNTTPNQKRQQRFWDGIERAGKGFTQSLKDSAALILKWTAGAGALAAAMTSSAHGVEQNRFVSRGLGMTTAQRSAFQVAYRNVADPDAMLGSTFNAQHDIGTSAFLSRLIGRKDIETMNTVDVAIKSINAVKDLVDKQKPGTINQQWLESQQLGKMGYDLETLQRLASATKEDVAAQEENYKVQEEANRQNEETQKKIVSLSQSMDAAKNAIEKNLTNAMIPLVPALENLTSKIVGLTTWLADIAPELKPSEYIKQSTNHFFGPNAADNISKMFDVDSRDMELLRKNGFINEDFHAPLTAEDQKSIEQDQLKTYRENGTIKKLLEAEDRKVIEKEDTRKYEVLKEKNAETERQKKAIFDRFRDIIPRSDMRLPGYQQQTAPSGISRENTGTQKQSYRQTPSSAIITVNNNSSADISYQMNKISQGVRA